MPETDVSQRRAQVLARYERLYGLVAMLRDFAELIKARAADIDVHEGKSGLTAEDVGALYDLGYSASDLADALDDVPEPQEVAHE